MGMGSAWGLAWHGHRIAWGLVAGADVRRTGARDFWDEGGLDAVAQQRVGVDAVALEEGVLPQRDRAAALLRAESLLHLDGEQAFDEEARLLGEEVLVDREPPPHDVLVHLELGGVDERRLQVRHLVREHADTPPVNDEVVPATEDHLGREVLRRAADGPGALVGGDDLGEAEIDDLEVAVLIDEQVLRLEVAVGDEVLVQVLEPARDVGGVESDVALTQLGPLTVGDVGDDSEELSALHDLEEQIEVAGVLVGAP